MRMKTFSRVAAIVFGLMMLALCGIILAEIVLRKFFNFSFGGVEELTGYAIAASAPLCFMVAAVEQSHIRINLLHMRLPRALQAGLNVLAALLLAALASALFVFSLWTVQQTREFGSVAQTPWATPLIYPQSLWLIGMTAFALAAVWLALRACWLALRGDARTLVREYGPDTVEGELQAELSDIEARS